MARIGLIDIESKIFNTVYMQIAQYHRNRGDIVEWWTPLEDHLFDYVYCSSLFDYTDKREVPDRAICGGTGFDVSSKLPVDIESCDLDYSIYPKCRKSFIRFSTGCFRNCSFCVVHEKEGSLKPCKPKSLNPNGKYIVVNDNNFSGNPEWEVAIEWLVKKKQPVDIQGLDVHLMTRDMCHKLCFLKHKKQMKIAWDDPRENPIQAMCGVLSIIPSWMLMCYVLIGYWSTESEDLYRVMTLKALGIDPFVMPYNKKDLYQKRFARWVNHKAIFKSVKWEDYKQGS